MFKAREVLLYFAIKFDGQYDLIMNAIRQKVKIDEDDYIRVIQAFKGNYLTILDDNYPLCFQRIYQPPLVLFYQGSIGLLDNLQQAIAVIGTRKPSEYGEKMTVALASDLARHDYIIVSGMARGIDTIAHECALKMNGSTIAVLGSGINYPYPKQNEQLYRSICDHGLVLSEYPDATKPVKGNFPERNRLVAALARAVLVVEAKKRSGTFITVGASLANGGDIFCVPNRADIESGTNQLIKDGAYLVETFSDIQNAWPK